MAGQAQNAIGAAKNIQNAVSSHSSTLGKVGAVVGEVRKLGGGGGGGAEKPRLSHLIEEHTDIAAPRSVVYNQWTQLEMFPTIVKGVQSVDQDEDDKAEWTSKIGPVRRTWQARITHQVPDEVIAWESEGGPQHTGVVTFHSLDVQLTRVLVQMQYKPSGPLETVGNTLRIQRRRVRRDLRMFKHFLELSGEETGEWRGRIDGSGDDRKPRRRSQSEGSSVRRSPRPSASRRPTTSRSGSSDGRSASGRGASANGRSTSRSTGSRSTGSRSTSGRSRSNPTTSNGGRSSSSGNGRSSSASGRGQSRSRASSGTRRASS